MTSSGSIDASATRPTPSGAWDGIPERLRARGLRWTPQRRILVDVLATTDGHVTGAELVERCRAIDPATIPSTVYRTLDVLEEIGFVSHSHASDGREQFHVLPVIEHGHLECRRCHTSWEIPIEEAAELVSALEQSRGFAVDLNHLSILGLCATCRAAGD